MAIAYSSLVTSAHAFVFDRGRLVLTKLTEEFGHRPGWDVPGGRREPGEAPLSALYRECLEEAGVLIQQPNLMGVIKVTSEGTAPPPNHPYPWPASYIALYLAEVREYQEINRVHEAVDRGVFDVDEAAHILRHEKGDEFLARLVPLAYELYLKTQGHMASSSYHVHSPGGDRSV